RGPETRRHLGTTPASTRLGKRRHRRRGPGIGGLEAINQPRTGVFEGFRSRAQAHWRDEVVGIPEPYGYARQFLPPVSSPLAHRAQEIAVGVCGFGQRRRTRGPANAAATVRARLVQYRSNRHRTREISTFLEPAIYLCQG